MSNYTSALPADTLGIDAGATLCKLARRGDSQEKLDTRSFDSTDLAAVQNTIRAWRPSRIVATGGGAAALGQELSGTPLRHAPEFEAWGRGAGIVAGLEGIELPDSYLLVSLGTGTSILRMSGAEARRVGGSALGGGTLLGLGRLLLGAETFDQLVALAERGDRRKVDLLVGDIYTQGELPLPAEINAASFGKLLSRQPADLAHALMGLVGENIGLICGQLAHHVGATAVLYCGSTLTHNPTLAGILRAVTAAYGVQVHKLDGGAYCGAVGAAALGNGRAKL